jgi:hypothetical protein
MPVGVTVESGFAAVEAGAWLMGRSQPAACFGEAVRRPRKGWVVRDRAILDLVETTGEAKCADAARPFLTFIPCSVPVSAVSGKVLVAPATARIGAEAVKPIPFTVKAALCATKFGLKEEVAGEPVAGGKVAGLKVAGEPVEGGKFESAQASTSPNFQTSKLQNSPSSEPSSHRTIAPSHHQTITPSNQSWVVMATGSRTARVPVADGDTLSVRPEAVVAWTGPRPSGFCPRLGLGDLFLPRPPKNLLLRFHGPCLVWLEGSGGAAANGNRPHPFERRIF